MLRAIVKALTIAILTISVLNAEENLMLADFMKTSEKTFEGEDRQVLQSELNSYEELVRLKALGHDVVGNKFLDWSQKERDGFFNYRFEISNRKASTKGIHSFLTTPTKFDWRTRGMVSPIKDQGEYGLSVAFASAAQYESLLAITLNGIIYDLSEEYIDQCLTEDPYCKSVVRSLQLMEEFGAKLESAYDSSNYPNICYEFADNIRLSENDQDVTFPELWNLTVSQLEHELVTYGPVTVGVSGSDPAFKYAGPSGLIKCTASQAVNHAVLLVGYNATHWFVKNSWGTTWGDEGFGYISKQDQNDCRIRSYVTEIRIDKSVFPKRLLAQSSPGSVGVETTTLDITMTDSGSNGWQGNVFGIRQNGVIVGTFGTGFITGNTFGPISIQVQGDKLAQIFTYQYGTNIGQIGFTIQSEDGTIILKRQSGSSFEQTSVQASFCPIANCPENKYPLPKALRLQYE